MDFASSCELSIGLLGRVNYLYNISMSKKLIRKFCAFTIICINYCLQIILPKAVTFNDPVLKYFTGKKSQNMTAFFHSYNGSFELMKMFTVEVLKKVIWLLLLTSII